MMLNAREHALLARLGYAKPINQFRRAEYLRDSGWKKSGNGVWADGEWVDSHSNVERSTNEAVHIQQTRDALAYLRARGWHSFCGCSDVQSSGGISVWSAVWRLYDPERQRYVNSWRVAYRRQIKRDGLSFEKPVSRKALEARR